MLDRKEITFYARYEANGKSSAPFIITSYRKALELNAKGYAIVFTGNVFRNNVRRIENLEKINLLYCDIDNHDGTYPKDSMLAKINHSPIIPSWVVETKNGYHCFWIVSDNPSIESFKDIELGICSYFNADTQALDPTRLLRVAGFYHTKDLTKKFACRKVLENNKEYVSRQLKRAFCVEKKALKTRFNYNTINYNNYNDKLLDTNHWEELFNLSTISKGGRNGTLTKIAYRIHEQTGISGNALYYIMLDINRRIKEPLDSREIQGMIRKWK